MLIVFNLVNQKLHVHAYATKSSGSATRKKGMASSANSTSSGNPFSDRDEESTPPKRRSAPATVQLEDSVASYFVNQLESDETKARKLAIAESAARTAERQCVAREAESKAMLRMLSAQTDDPDETAKHLSVADASAQTDDPDETAKHLSVADKEADAKVNESMARIVEAKAGADEAKASTERKPVEARLRPEESKTKIARKVDEAKARGAVSKSQKQFMLPMAAMMGTLAEKLQSCGARAKRAFFFLVFQGKKASS